MPKRAPGQRRGDQRWSTFLRNHATAILACDFFVTVTATFRMLYVFVVIEHGTRRLAHLNVTAHPTADWTLQQLREVVGDTDNAAFLIHDRDAIFSKRLDASVEALGMTVLRSPFASPTANAICERLIGTARMPGLDDSNVGGASAFDPPSLAQSLQHRPPSQRVGPRRSRPATRICTSHVL